MSGSLSILSALLYNYKIINLKILFTQEFNIQTANNNPLSEFVIHKFNQYPALYTKDYHL